MASQGKLRVLMVMCMMALALQPVISSSRMYFVNNIMEVHGQLVGYCNATVGQEATDDLMNIFVTTGECLKIEELYVEAEKYIEEGNVKGIMELHCRSKSDHMACFTKASTIIKNCLPPEEHVIIDLYYSVLTGLSNFVCNNVDEIVAAMSPENEMCAAVWMAGAEKCMMQLGLGMTENVWRRVNPSAKLVLPVSRMETPYEEMCLIMEEARECINGVEGQCTGMVKLTDSLYKELANTMSCETDGGASQGASLLCSADPFNVLSRLLLSLLTAGTYIHLY